MAHATFDGNVAWANCQRKSLTTLFSRQGHAPANLGSRALRHLLSAARVVFVDTTLLGHVPRLTAPRVVPAVAIATAITTRTAALRLTPPVRLPLLHFGEPHDSVDARGDADVVFRDNLAVF